MKKNIYIYIVSCLSFIPFATFAQELNVKVTLNTQKIQNVDTDLFKSLEDALTLFLNENKWTNANFRVNEKIETTLTITVNSSEGTRHTCDLQLTCRRPVYNSAYTTPTFNFKDAEFTFDYNRESLDYNEATVSNNLVAVMSYYAYILIGLDFDSFSQNGGKPYFEKAMEIANASQSLNEIGWKPFDNDRNRYALALALTEESSRSFHDMWYKYHRLGMDEMSANSDRGRTRIIESLADLDLLYQSRPSSVLLSIYGDTKLDELVNVYTKATMEEKTNAHKILQKIYPTKGSTIDKIKEQPVK